MAIDKWLTVIFLGLLVVHAAAVYQDSEDRPSSLSYQTATSNTHIVVIDAPCVVTDSTVAPAFRQARSAGSPSAGDKERVINDFVSQALDLQQTIFSDGISTSNSALSGDAAGGVGARSASASPARIIQQFAYAINAFTATGLSDAQLQALTSHPKVLSVTPSRMHYLQTITTPDFLNISGPIWGQYGGPQNASSNLLIGVLDTGIEPSRDSFASVTRGTNPWPSMGPGTDACNETSTCTAGKLIGCRYFQDAIIASINGTNMTQAPDDASTCHDGHGHGTHTSSTAGGNHNVTATIAGGGVTPPGMSGMAPGSALGMYKVLWNLVDTTTGAESNYGTDGDIVNAIDKAVSDGVDIISYSIGSSPANFTFQDPIWLAFGNAAAAGVFVSAAGGNAGTDDAVDNPLPWGITVAAGTHDRSENATVTLSPSGGTFPGKTLPTKGVGPAPLYFAGPAFSDAALCFADTLDGNATGKVVVCQRGVTARVSKSAEVARVGGVGMILVNTNNTDDSTSNDLHSVPSIHVQQASGDAILAAYDAAPTATNATLSGGKYYYGSEAPFVADFSSRGPARTDSAALLKPDILAPGVDIFAAWVKVNGSNDTANIISGTSMATPHISGIAALIIGNHADWSPAAVKSAIMTTATQVTNKGNPLTGTPFDYGAGMVNPVKAMDPGLVYDAGQVDYARYLCVTLKDTSIGKKKAKKPKTPSSCTALCKKPYPTCTFPQTLRDFNYPSFSFNGAKKGSTVKATRNATFVGTGAPTFTAKVKLPDGFIAAINPVGTKKPIVGSDLTLAFTKAGDAQAYTLFITVPKTAPSGWHFGSITWTDDQAKYTVFSTIAVNVP